jgi:hypothetical protein
MATLYTFIRALFIGALFIGALFIGALFIGALFIRHCLQKRKSALPLLALFKTGKISDVAVL